LDEAIKLVKPGALFRNYGNVIEKHAKSRNCSVIRTYCGHGINSVFHCPPNIPHYAKNKAVGEAKPGMCFTIEPMIALGTYRDKTWPDDWTSVTQDGKRTAQFGMLSKSHLPFHKANCTQNILFLSLKLVLRFLLHDSLTLLEDLLQCQSLL
jgi:methionine aminopeptidase